MSGELKDTFLCPVCLNVFEIETLAGAIEGVQAAAGSLGDHKLSDIHVAPAAKVKGRKITNGNRLNRLGTTMVKNFEAVSARIKRNFCSAMLQIGMVLYCCSVFVNDRKAWASSLSKRVIGRGGTVQWTAEGVARYEPSVSFVERATGIGGQPPSSRFWIARLETLA